MTAVEHPTDAAAVEPTSVAFVEHLERDQYARVGTIAITWSGLRGKGQIMHDAEIRTALRTEAAKMGANAITEVHPIHHSPQYVPFNEAPPKPELVMRGIVATAVRVNEATSN
ncbi:MAG TPA: hypothetical protein VF980_11065 [Thermoanaerobaculia bacterium]